MPSTRRVRTGQETPVDLMQTAVERIDRPNPALNAVLQVVGRRVNLLPFTGDDPDVGVSEIVAIGRQIDAAHLDELFSSCLVEL